MKKQLVLGLALAAATTCSFADWSPQYLSGRYTSTVTYGAFGQTAQPINSTEQMDAGGHAAGPVGNFAQMALTLQPELLADLNRASAASVTSGVTFSGGVLTGALQLYMVAPLSGPVGVNHVSMTGPTYTATYVATGKYMGVLPYSCTVRATMANLQVGGSYNTTTSQLDASQTTMTFTPQTAASCSTAIDWIPIFGNWASRLANGTTQNKTYADLSALQGRTLQSVLPGAPQYLGFNATIPSGIFKFGGQDMGDYIRNNSATLFGAPGTSVNITIGAPQIEGPFVYGLSETAPRAYYNTEFAITFNSFAGSLGYKVASERYFDYVWKCPGNVTHCNEP